MKKYNKPEIVTLALESVDVIETSGGALGAGAITSYATENSITVSNVKTIEKQITDMSGSWSW